MSFSDSFRTLRRRFKAAMPYVRRREYRILQRRYGDLIEGIGWAARPAVQARLRPLKSIEQPLIGDVCLFVSHATAPRLKYHVAAHLEQLLRVGVHVVLILNTELDPDAIVMDPRLRERLAGVFVRENTGFDFAAWAHLFTYCDRAQWTRLFLVNDSIVGPLNTADFDRVIMRARASSAGVVGLTENRSPPRHLQSFFLVLSDSALRNPLIEGIFARMLSLPTKAQVIEVYEYRLTGELERSGVRCEALFAPLADELESADDTSFRWAELIRAGFPYVKASVANRFAGSAELVAMVPAEFLRPEV